MTPRTRKTKEQKELEAAGWNYEKNKSTITLTRNDNVSITMTNLALSTHYERYGTQVDVLVDDDMITNVFSNFGKAVKFVVNNVSQEKIEFRRKFAECFY